MPWFPRYHSCYSSIATRPFCVCVFPQLKADILTVTHAFSDGLPSRHSGDIALNIGLLPLTRACYHDAMVFLPSKRCYYLPCGVPLWRRCRPPGTVILRSFRHTSIRAPRWSSGQPRTPPVLVSLFRISVQSCISKKVIPTVAESAYYSAGRHNLTRVDEGRKR